MKITNSNPPPTSTADKIARAAQDYSKRANNPTPPPNTGGGMPIGTHGGSVGGTRYPQGQMGGMVGGLFGGSATAPKTGGLGAAVMSSLSPEAARDILRRNHDKLGSVLGGILRSKAGPVKQ